MRWVKVSKLDQVSLGVGVDRELTNREEGATDRQWVDDRIDAGTVGETSVHQRCCLIDAPTDLTDDLVDDPAKVDIVDEAHFGLDDLSSLFARRRRRGR